jgi:hypothetical protein
MNIYQGNFREIIRKIIRETIRKIIRETIRKNTYQNS